MTSMTRRVRLLLRGAIYLCCIGLSLTGAFLLRYDFLVPAGALAVLYKGLLLGAPIKLAVFHLYKLDRTRWEAAGMADLLHVAWSNAFASIAFTTAALIVIGRPFPRSIYVVDLALCFLATAAASFLAQLWGELAAVRSVLGAKKRVLIYGAGSAGLTLVRELRANAALGCAAAGFLDDDHSKLGAVLMGVTVLGTGRSAAAVVQRLKARGVALEEIILAMPSATGRQMRAAVANCRSSGLVCRIVPGVGELLAGKVLSAQVRNVSITDLLGRDPVKLDQGRILQSLAERVVLVTGGAGSIGSELCRQIAGFGVSKLVILDQAESDLFQIDMELREAHPALELVLEIGDICDPARVDEIIASHQVSAIFHAAAYKHVPMMELHPLIAVQNNVLGTRNLAQAALRHGVRNFLMISSDKAVNPTNVMGATKRAAELIVTSMPSDATCFVSVRFGNVLGSNGSVVKTFQAQIAKGGPVTVTHPQIRRYFMTIPEAVQLVLQAFSMGQGSEIFVLDMGEPVRIMDLAENMIRLSGLSPQDDIAIRITGLRPGEKLYEEIMIRGENILPTYHDKIKIFADPARPDPVRINRWLSIMEGLVASRDRIGIIQTLTDMVPEYQPSSRWKELAAAPIEDEEPALAHAGPQPRVGSRAI